MDRLINWLNVPIPKKRIPAFVFCAIGISLAWNMLATTFLQLLNLEPRARENLGVPILSAYAIILLALAAIIEEVLFRFIPIRAVILARGVGKLCLFSLVLSSLFFGYLHGGFENVALQGVSGFILGITFIKCGASSRRYLQGLAASISVHMLFNTVVFVGAVLGGTRTV